MRWIFPLMRTVINNGVFVGWLQYLYGGVRAGCRPWPGLLVAVLSASYQSLSNENTTGVLTVTCSPGISSGGGGSGVARRTVAKVSLSSDS
jgi:hypothetical protein